ncbi:TrkA family potassium uptake protein [Dehalococcoidia bacterium]|nr:TrkA family potassium uptake protein [Dehalococcoidia bacterium]
MYVLIVGAGRVGTAVARWLLEADHEIAIIDNDESRCLAIEEELGGVAVHGEGTEESILGRAGANRADVFISTTRRDDENLVACQLAKHRFGAARVVALINVPEHIELFTRLGIDISINTTELLVNKIQEDLASVMIEELRGF